MLRRLLFASLALAACTAWAQPIPVKVKVFVGSQDLPLFAAQSQGIFEHHGLKVDVLFTKTSQEQRDGLAAGEFQVAHTAADNAVAMVEGAKRAVIVAGGDSSMTELIVQPSVRSVADLKGRTIIVDAPNTAYAIQLKKILLLGGLKEGADYSVKQVGSVYLRFRALQEHKDYAATTLTAPFSVEAPGAGLRRLGRVVDLIGPYQGISAVVMDSWAKANPDVLERYLAALIEATRWAVSPANRKAAEQLLAAHLKLQPDVAARCWELLADPQFGLQTDARFDAQGFRNVLALRAEIEGSWGGKPPAPDKYVDLSYYDSALKKVSR
ncbi:MAG TPA: ABC transporter substrate-binding protein [Burkholderiales bacterium]|jgi:ABC-type nitrate/sulfonate/bicarbonate transport system substrate-binding protein|nr:ABC transporter substrate-binding protein [Burkholderiales bacterium]